MGKLGPDQGPQGDNLRPKKKKEKKIKHGFPNLMSLCLKFASAFFIPKKKKTTQHPPRFYKAYGFRRYLRGARVMGHIDIPRESSLATRPARGASQAKHSRTCSCEVRATSCAACAVSPWSSKWSAWRPEPRRVTGRFGFRSATAQDASCVTCRRMFWPYALCALVGWLWMGKKLFLLCSMVRAQCTHVERSVMCWRATTEQQAMC